MQTSKLHTLEDLLTKGIMIEGQDDPKPVPFVFIPKIQRAYAQGRKSETDVRKDFLDFLFGVLTADEEKKVELSFLFGSKQFMAKRKNDGFELLDGQQRTTTLFLLYWYLGMKEQKKVPAFLPKFTYETRDTSVQFLERITSSDFLIDLKQSAPSKAIKANKWFTDDFYCDSTVCAMLNMLDAIDEKYNDDKYNMHCSNLYGRLNRIQFYVLMLEKFDMNDELYIKMNSRGLSLVPFENFKASIVKFMKAKERNGIYGGDEVEGGQPPFWFVFISKIDAKWIDLFWKYQNESQDECKDIIIIDDASIGTSYLNFFNRYMFTKAALGDNMEHNKINALSSFFYNEAESNKMKERFFGWENYEKMFVKDDSYFKKLNKVLDVFHEHWSIVKSEIEKDPFRNVHDFELNIEEIKLPQRVVFAAITEFIERIPENLHFNDTVVIENFRRMLRVVFNIIENTLVETVEQTIRVIKACEEIISANGAIDGNFYQSLANNSNSFKSGNQQLKEEIEKANEMFAGGNFDRTWEQAFMAAEKHPFFKGSVRFFFTPGAGNSSDFAKRYDVVKDLFDKEGVSSAYRKDHILIRAIISQINYWDQGLKDRYITERAETQKYLKMLLTGYEEVRKMVCRYFDNKFESRKTIFDYFRDDIIGSAVTKPGESKEFGLLFHRLVTDTYAPALFDWMYGVEKDKKRFRIQFNRSSYLVNIPGAWYDRIILDTERHLIIPELVKQYSLSYEDKNQQKMMEGPVKDSWGWDVFIYKKNGDYKLQLSFNESKWVDFFVFGPDIDRIVQHFGNHVIHDALVKTPEKVKVGEMKYGLFDNDYQPIKEKTDKLLALLNSI